jgi:tRNA pseudouridine55 synthase
MAKELAPIISGVLNLYKRRSETPLQTIERYVKDHPEYKGSKMTYAGRLDPMAEGVLVVLSGDKNKERDVYTGMDKEYEFEFMLGVDTDTHDVLGVISAAKEPHTTESAIKGALEKFQGAFIQKYPVYSSKVVDGTPLYELARKGRTDSIVLPQHEVVVSKMEFLGARAMSKNEFARFLHETIGAVKGDFRQKEVLKHWDKYLKDSPEAVIIYKARVACGSGFYVRQLVSDLGHLLGTGAVTISILRTRVGEYKLEDSIK